MVGYATQLTVGVSLVTAFLFLLLRIISRSTTAATILLFLVEVALMSVNDDSPLAIGSSVIVAVILVMLFRGYGLLALAAMMLFLNLGELVPFTLDASVWYFGRSLIVIVMAAALAAYAFWVSLAAQPAFGMALLEEE